MLAPTWCASAPLLFRNNAGPLQPGRGSDHPCLCLPGSHGGLVLLCGAAHQGQEQAKAEEAARQTAHVPPAANDGSDGEKPHCLSGTAAWSHCCEDNLCWAAALELVFTADKVSGRQETAQSMLPDTNLIRLSLTDGFSASYLLESVLGRLD